MIGALADTEYVCLTSLGDRELLVEPLQDLFDRLVLTDRLTFGQASEQKSNLLHRDAQRPSLLALITETDRALGAQSTSLDLDPQRRIDRSERGCIGTADGCGEIFNQSDDRRRNLSFLGESLVRFGKLVGNGLGLADVKGDCGHNGGCVT